MPSFRVSRVVPECEVQLRKLASVEFEAGRTASEFLATRMRSVGLRRYEFVSRASPKEVLAKSFEVSKRAASRSKFQRMSAVVRGPAFVEE